MSAGAIWRGSVPLQTAPSSSGLWHCVEEQWIGGLAESWPSKKIFDAFRG